MKRLLILLIACLWFSSGCIIAQEDAYIVPVCDPYYYDCGYDPYYYEDPYAYADPYYGDGYGYDDGYYDDDYYYG